MHELYDVKTDIPTFSVITDASVHDSQVMELIPYEKESFYIFDRAYMATEKLYIIEEAEAYFVVREKHKMSFEVIEDKEYNNPSSGIMADQIIRFKGHKTKKQYPKELRRVVFYDYDGNRTFVFYSGTGCPALQIQMESRTVLQMAEATSAHQRVLWNLGECCKNTNLCSYYCILSCRYRTRMYGAKASNL